MQELKSDLRRAFGKPFLFAMLGSMLCVLFGAFSDVLLLFKGQPPSAMLFEHRGITIRALSGSVMLFAAPLLTPIPYAGAFVDDVKSGYLKAYLPRTSVTRYIVGKELACALSGALSLVGGIVLGHILITLVLIPIETFSGMPVDPQLGALLGRVGLYGLFGALFAMTGMLLSTMTMNAYMAYAAPFILYYVLIIIQERYARGAFMLNPQNYLTLTGAWPFGGWSAALTILVLLACLMLGFYLIAQGHLRDDNARKSIRTLLPRRRVRLDRPARRPPLFRPLSALHQVGAVVRYNFRMWRGNARVLLTFALAFILCFLLSDKAVRFAREYDAAMQLVEAFVWTFGDANSILLSSLMLLLLFADMPFLSPATPFYLLRIDRRTWIAGQALYVAGATGLYLLFVLVSTSLVCMTQSFAGNMWSETAAILGYSGAGQSVALPALVKTLEMSTPYACMAAIFLLMLLYALLLAFLMLLCNLRFGQRGGVAAALGFSLYGYLLNPETIRALLDLPAELMYRANVAVGWLSPLNHATYHMHNFGYDLLPRLGETYLLFAALIALMYLLSVRAARGYGFNFSGTENG